MDSCTRVDFHCHSVLSRDAVLSPEELADRLAASGVAFASLTDHDTTEGLAEFHQRLRRHHLGFVSGVEITTQYDHREVHLLAYGIDPAHAELQATLHALRQARPPTTYSLAESLRRQAGPPAATTQPATSAAPEGKLPLAEAIALVHRAGGRAFLAHPLTFEPDLVRLRAVLSDWQAQGLDGIEAIYGPYSLEQRQALEALAESLGLLISAGTDGHRGNAELGIDLPTPRWRRFREAVCFNSSTADPLRAPPPPHPAHRGHWRSFCLRIILPAVLAVGLFAVALFALLLPAFERSLLDRKRELIRELTRSACSILTECEREERAGRLGHEQAQTLARSRVEALRYGHESKDYFWIQDLQPRMIMHPYRTDLNGQDLTAFRDPRGARIFVKFADLVRRQGEGYLEYVWQWQDDPRRLALKESYVQGFAPWGWLVGTGMYIEDVHEEISRIKHDFVRIFLAITAVVGMLLAYLVLQSSKLEQHRAEAEDGLRESTERYRALVEAATEGTLLVLKGRCRYANPTFLRMLGYAAHDLELLELEDLLPAEPGNALATEAVRRLQAGEEPTAGFEATLRRRDGRGVECALALSRIAFTGTGGFILLAKEIRLRDSDGPANRERWPELARMADAAPTGLFRARADRPGAILEANAAALGFLPRPAHAPAATARFLADLFGGDPAYEPFLADLQREGQVERPLHLVHEDASLRTLLLRASLTRDDRGQPRFIDGVLEDISLRDRREVEREALVEKLQTTLLFLHEPVSHLVREMASCRLDTPIREAAALMTAQHSGLALVRTDAGEVIGIVTDDDLRQRVVAGDTAPTDPVRQIMSTPVVTVPAEAPLYLALLRMQEQGTPHLAVADELGRIVGTIRAQEVLQFESYGPVVLTREILRAPSVAAVVRSCRRVPSLAKALLATGAHPHYLTRLVTSACDAATERLIALASQDLGPAPAPFAFLALGSQGRLEQTLCTDQDNALIYASPSEATAAEPVKRYFLALGTRVCAGLDQAGYAYCHGEAMARNPRWCQSLEDWQRCFATWIHQAEPQELMEFSIFFDFRCVTGDPRLAADLRRYLHDTLRGHPAFFPRFAQNSLLFKPPMRLFGHLLGGGKDHPERLDLKQAMLPIVNSARLYALQHELDATNTLARIDALARQGVLAETVRDEIVAAYDFLMRLRLQRQVAAIQAGEPPDNAIDHRRLTPTEETLLTQAFARITAVQARISRDFLGT